jgi:RHS repeat-associated protein
VTNGITTTYTLDVNRSLPVVLNDGTDDYVYGQGLAYAVDASNHAFVYHTDGLGSVREVTSGSGTIVATYQTDAFGNPLQTGGSFSQPFQFTGQQADPTGLYNLRAGLYDPNTGRFMQQDPLFGNSNDPRSLNRYTYVENDPATATDPAGWCDTGVAGDPGCNGSDLSVGSPMIGPCRRSPPRPRSPTRGRPASATSRSIRERRAVLAWRPVWWNPERKSATRPRPSFSRTGSPTSDGPGGP